MSRHADAIVVGGGAVGCSVAWHLAREGLRVLLLERGELAAEASGAAAGMLAPVGEAADDPADPILVWGLRSLAGFTELCEALRAASGVDPELEPSGLLRLASDDASARRLRARADALGAAHDLGLEWLDARAVHDAEPRLARDVVGGLWSPREAHVRSPLLARAFAGSAAALGARVACGVAVSGLEREGDRVTGVRTGAGVYAAGHVVLCTGAWAGELAGWLGGAFAPPVFPVRGQICSLDAPQPPPRSILWRDSLYLVPKRDGSLVMGATEEDAGFDRRVTAAALAGLLEDARALVPELGGASFRHGWAGLRPATPDRLPLVGAVPGLGSLWLAAGHYRNGVLLSPVTGRLVADLLLGKALPDDAAPFAPERFAQ